MIFLSEEGRTITKMASIKSVMARMEGITMEIKNRFRLSWGISVKLSDLKEETVSVKYTKTTAHIITCHGRNPNNNWKIFKAKLSVSILLESLWVCYLKSTSVSMPCKSYFAREFLHQLEVGPEFLPTPIKTFDNSG
jgi:hypothetical protein